MPLRVQMEFGLVDEDDPLSILVQRHFAQEQEQLKLTGAEKIHLETKAVGRAQVNVECSVVSIGLLAEWRPPRRRCGSSRGRTHARRR